MQTPLKNVSYHKYLGVILSDSCKDDLDIKQQCKNVYSGGNILIRNFRNCTDEVKCHLFKTFCSNIYCSALWNKYNKESMRQLKVAYNRVFRSLMHLEHRVSMSPSFIRRGLDPFPVILRKSVSSFRKRVLDSKNIPLLIVNILFLVALQVIGMQSCFYYTEYFFGTAIICFSLRSCFKFY